MPEYQLEAGRRVDVVVDDQDALVLRAFGRSGRAGRYGLGAGSVRCACGRARQRDAELAAEPGARAAGLDRAALQLDDLLDQGQTDAESALRAFAVIVDLPEHLENLAEPFCRDTDAAVGHAQLDPVVDAVHAQTDAAAWIRIPGRVVQQVRDHLNEA